MIARHARIEELHRRRGRDGKDAFAATLTADGVTFTLVLTSAENALAEAALAAHKPLALSIAVAAESST